MLISSFFKSPVVFKKDELIENLQADARMLFYDRMMYDINDSLTSILAICDIETKESIPKIKQYINRINLSLRNTKDYQISSCGEKEFNISLVLKNLVRVINEHFRNVKIFSLIPKIKAHAVGSQSDFEKTFLQIFVYLFLRDDEPESDITLELSQKDQGAIIKVARKDYTLPDKVLKKSNEISKHFKGDLQILSDSGAVEVIFRLPLLFQLINKKIGAQERT